MRRFPRFLAVAATLASTAAASLALGACEAQPIDLTLKQRGVGDDVKACLDRTTAGAKVSSVGEAVAGPVLTAPASTLKTDVRNGLRENLEAGLWAADGRVVVAVGRAKEMLPATTPEGVPSLPNQSVMVWTAPGSLDAARDCLDTVAR